MIVGEEERLEARKKNQEVKSTSREEESQIDVSCGKVQSTAIGKW
jgi:hypothetical protein